MKTILLTVICLTGILMADANTEWVDAQIEAIKPPRQGVSHSAIDQVSNPFLYLYAPTKKVVKTAQKTRKVREVLKPAGPHMQLLAVMNNTALINGKWYKINDQIAGYTLAKVDTDSVLLTKPSGKKMLFISTENKNIKIQVK